ncbi:MAG: prepilin-type N-terminal cleavage/methylation domain-containing protein [Candidatus Omnitrophica bacterium]|nr:prepilin-type N-terminal cleavage/methylation domain-containing protein [Candidatus Omnitrophota bacterium]
MRKSFKGFTLLEVIIVTIIIGILAVLGLASFAGPKEQAAEREAQANVKLVSSAEKIYRMEIGEYIGCTNTGEVNGFLKLMLPVSDTNWKYSVKTASLNTTFIAKAQRTSGPKSGITAYCIDETQDNASICAW